MIHVYKGKAKNILASVTLLLLLALTVFSGNKFPFPANFHTSLTFDTLPPKKKSKILKRDETDERIQKALLNKQQAAAAKQLSAAKTPGAEKVSKDTLVPVVDTFSIKYAKDALDAPVEYHADDSMVLDVPGKKLYLYGKENKTIYKDNELVAPAIQYDQRTNLVTAHMVKDSLGNVVSYANFKQGEFNSQSDTLRFNMINGKGQTKGTYFTQNEFFVYAAVSKKIDSVTIYARKARFTTCNLDTPHFAFVSNQVKFINQRMAFTGPVHPEFEGVPIPVVLPFGIYPLKQGRHSGILAPTFTANEQLGLALEGLGYYKVLSDNWDMTARGTIYSYGGWTASVSPRYYKRYRYQGSFSLDVQHINFGLRSDPDFSGSRTFNIRWNHSQDNKSRPGVTFTASVNGGSSKFNAATPNSPARNFTNQLNSSITYAKVWKDKPYNISVSANHSQNTQNSTINLNLPDVAFNVNTLYPFRRKEAVGELKWYENVGVALNTNAKSLTSFTDTLNNIGKQIGQNFQWGARHSVPITLSLPQLGAFQIAPSVSYEERWFQRQFIRKWNETGKKVDTIRKDGFYTARDMSFGLSATTRIFGMFTFGKNSRVQALRHEIRPSFGLSYKPDFNSRSFYNTQVDTSKNVSRFNVYEGSIFGGFGEGMFGGLTFAVDNVLQMKVRSRKDTGENAIKKVTLIDGFGMNGSYNLLADSFALSNLSFSFRSNLFEKINITAGFTTDPYKVNEFGRRIDKLVWTSKPVSLGRLTSGNVSVQSQFRGGNSDNKGNKKDLSRFQQQYNPATGQPLDEYQQEAAYINNNPGEFADFSIPWSVSLSYSLRFDRQLRPDYSGFVTNIFQDVTWNGDLNLTPKWKIGMNGTYNFSTKELGTVSMFLSREMHCWQMSINASPVGRYRFFNFTISPKSGLLRDLKINRTRYFYDL